MPTTARRRESDLAARWSAGRWRGATLQADGGETYRVVFAARFGGGAGPDFRDAVLARADGTHVYDDIELHLRPVGWYAHGHASDPRYNGLALHVVLTRGARDRVATPLTSGRTVPLVVLGDGELPVLTAALGPWPCFGILTEGAPWLLTELLHTAGMARFTEHSAALEHELRMAPWSAGRSGDRWDGPNRVLWLALAEALGFGRDRATLRRPGQSLLDVPSATLDEALLPGIERMRARGLLAWHTRWRSTCPWRALELALGVRRRR